MTKRPKKRRSTRKLSTLDDFVAKQGKREEFEAVAVNEAAASPLVPSPHSPSKTGVNALRAGEGSESVAAKKNG